MKQPVILIDAGNTRIKWGVHDGGRLKFTGAVPTTEPEKLEAAIPAKSNAKAAWVSNVAGVDAWLAISAVCASRGIDAHRVEAQAEQLGLTNLYTDPRQLGADRWLGAIAAHHWTPGNKLVVMAGTALTIDAVDGQGTFQGGIIVPGPYLMRRALEGGTAGLRLTEGEFAPLPKRTPDAITSGAIQACVGAIERMAQVMWEAGSAPEKIVMSGGAAREIAPHLPLEYEIQENLVLEGLALVARAR